MKNVSIPYLLLFLSCTIVVNACKEPDKKREKAVADESGQPPPSYDFAKGEKVAMKKKLKEISGIHYLRENLLAAVQDEKGTIYTVDFSSGEISNELDFGGSGDYEDLTMDAGFYYVLESSGRIFKVPGNGDAGKPEVFSFPADKKTEFETLYLDASGQNLVLICKKCPGEGKGSTINAYGFSLKDQRFREGPLFSVQGEAARTLLEETGARPSAAAIHPVENKLYVLCSVGKLLLVCDLEGKVENAYPLEPSTFKQPEGLTFSPDGNMFISNEAAEGTADIIKFSYKP